MTPFRLNLSKTLVILGMAAFLVMGYFALCNLATPMDMGKDVGKNMGTGMSRTGEVPDQSSCPFAQGTSLCTMGPLDHISAWHGVFSNVLPEMYSVFILLLVLVTAFVFTFTILGSPPLRQFKRSKIAYTEYIPTAALQILFSRGILNPKPF